MIDKLEIMDLLASVQDMLIEISDQLEGEMYFEDDVLEMYNESIKKCEGTLCKDQGECFCITDSLGVNVKFLDYDQKINDILEIVNPITNKLLKENKDEWEALETIKYAQFIQKHEHLFKRRAKAFEYEEN